MLSRKRPIALRCFTAGLISTFYEASSAHANARRNLGVATSAQPRHDRDLPRLSLMRLKFVHTDNASIYVNDDLDFLACI
ncbi:hypothetical protein K505DRAFT_161708 [Melanomma pulvis-pyrius CBS 109.77]|uniref:Uncharacterized protein n=1 Tax=Melanomma pulvis-pyrius CBS 109.77 TaxID=1314802 RepID=A0A6A6WPB3_9PLEO|nr:hypothetical protein K505DRAFT_161708 [Melanomma pulvis-pyrius CBS 109.77]